MNGTRAAGSARARISRATLLVALLLSAGCTGTQSPRASAPKLLSETPLEFTLGTLTGELLSARALRGRVTLLAFVTTFDLASQGQARVLDEIFHTHRPRVNVALVALEPPDHAVLVSAFQESLGLDFPVAMAEVSEQNAFDSVLRVERVPTTLILDKAGRALFKRVGLIPLAELEALLRRAENAS